MNLPDHLAQWMSGNQSRFFGELHLSTCAESGRMRCSHKADREANSGELMELTTVQEVREMVKFDESGEYRPLKTAPTLKHGWVIFSDDIEAFYKMIDAIYPAGFAITARYLEGKMPPVPLRETLNRQTGMYQFSKNITDQHANQIMRDTCASGCLRQIAWPIDDKCAVSHLPAAGKSIPLICTEACTFVVSEARRLAREAYDMANKPKES